jgi:hypothetical protein
MLSGTITTRTVLSTLAETSMVAVGLNFKHVDGRSCTFRIDSRGCEDGQLLASTWFVRRTARFFALITPTDMSAAAKASSLPSAL